MRPYPYRQAREDEVKRAYIYRMCHARHVIENASGALAKK
jgi:hypothetical protein